MKAWHVQDINGENHEIVYAETRGQAILKSEAIGWNDYIDVRAKRAKYADDLNTEPVKLLQAQFDNGWWFECHGKKCRHTVTVDDNYTIIDGFPYCEKCSK